MDPITNVVGIKYVYYYYYYYVVVVIMSLLLCAVYGVQVINV